jgi:hypothetical protein
LDYSSNKGKGIVFNTHSFTEAEVRQMCTELESLERDRFILHHIAWKYGNGEENLKTLNKRILILPLPN